jgi:hypothetical protein
MNHYSAGDSIDAWCTKCKLELEHTIIAMVNNTPGRVQCNTCKGQHNYRAKPYDKKPQRAKSAARKTKSPEEKYNEYMAQFMGVNPSHATKYSIRGNFRENELIDHPTFGIGIVLSIIQMNKIEILFKTGMKLLVQNKR